MPNTVLYLPFTDPQVQAAIAYLEKLGAPIPTKLDRSIPSPNSPGGSYMLDTLFFDDGKGHTAEIDATLSALFPNVAAATLQFHGLIPAGAVFDNVPVLTVNGTTTPKFGSTTALPASVRSSTPIGPLVAGVTPPHWQNNPGWESLNIGTPWTQNGKKYKLAGSMTVAGKSVWWVGA